MGSDREVILICGPESSGKSTLSKLVQEELHATLIPDYSRIYINNLDKPYAIKDIHNMAIRHKALFDAAKGDIVILDSFLLNYKIWLAYKFQVANAWIDTQLADFRPTYCFLLAPDIEWEDDPLREHPQERHLIFGLYKEQLEKMNWNYILITGQGQSRFDQVLSRFSWY